MGKNETFYHLEEIQPGPDDRSDPRGCRDPKLLLSYLLQAVFFESHLFLSLPFIICFTQAGTY